MMYFLTLSVIISSSISSNSECSFSIDDMCSSLLFTKVTIHHLISSYGNSMSSSNSLVHDALIVFNSVYNYSFLIMPKCLTNCGPPRSVTNFSAFKNALLLLSFTLEQVEIKSLNICILSIHTNSFRNTSNQKWDLIWKESNSWEREIINSHHPWITTLYLTNQNSLMCN